MVTAAVQHVESNYDAIRSEYFSAVLGQGRDTNLDDGSALKPLEPDYDVATKGECPFLFLDVMCDMFSLFEN